MITTKSLADLLTALRFGLAWYILWLGISSGAEALPLATLVLIAAWVTDVLDGPLARRDPTGRRTWIGDHDLETDMAVSIGVLAYLALSSFVSPQLAITYVVLCGALLRHYRSLHLAWGVQAPPYACMLYVALRNAPTFGFIAVGYIALVVIATWPRFPQETIPQFLGGMRTLGRARQEADTVMLIENGNGNS